MINERPIEKNISKFIGKSNGKNIFITAEFCDIWSFDFDVKKFKNSLIKSLNKCGFTVNYTIIPKLTNNYEYFIYYGEENNKKIIFSNNSNLHKKQGAIIGNEITKKNISEIIKKIEYLSSK